MYLKNSIRRVVKLHYLLIAMLAGQAVTYDGWQLLTPESIAKRWIALTALFITVTSCGYLIKLRKTNKFVLFKVVWVLIIADVIFASYSVYLSRGMASRAVALFAVPIIVSAVFASRRALFLTSSLAAASYVITAFIYFDRHFNEGYKIELYGEVGFYSALMFILAGLLWAVIRYRKKY